MFYPSDETQFEALNPFISFILQHKDQASVEGVQLADAFRLLQSIETLQNASTETNRLPDKEPLLKEIHRIALKYPDADPLPARKALHQLSIDDEFSPWLNKSTHAELILYGVLLNFLPFFLPSSRPKSPLSSLKIASIRPMLETDLTHFSCHILLCDARLSMHDINRQSRQIPLSLSVFTGFENKLLIGELNLALGEEYCARIGETPASPVQSIHITRVDHAYLAAADWQKIFKRLFDAQLKCDDQSLRFMFADIGELHNELEKQLSSPPQSVDPLQKNQLDYSLHISRAYLEGVITPLFRALRRLNRHQALPWFKEYKALYHDSISHAIGYAIANKDEAIATQMMEYFEPGCQQQKMCAQALWQFFSHKEDSIKASYYQRVAKAQPPQISATPTAMLCVSGENTNSCNDDLKKDEASKQPKAPLRATALPHRQ